MGLFDRIWRNDDGSEFFGQDDENGKTTWYDSEGNLDSISDTPSDWDQEKNDEDR